MLGPVHPRRCNLEDNKKEGVEPKRVEEERFGGAKVVTAACGSSHAGAETVDGALVGSRGSGSSARWPRARGRGPSACPRPCPPALRRVDRCLALGTSTQRPRHGHRSHGRLGGGSVIMITKMLAG
jgi:hypothetical protein